jgi:hypothetical protein
MNRIYTALKAAHDALLDIGDDDNANEIETAISMFEPRKGDDPEVAKARQMMNCHCKNCGLEWPAMAMPAPLTDVALTGQRIAKCPRCFATEDIYIGS